MQVNFSFIVCFSCGHFFNVDFFLVKLVNALH